MAVEASIRTESLGNFVYESVLVGGDFEQSAHIEYSSFLVSLIRELAPDRQLCCCAQVSKQAELQDELFALGVTSEECGWLSPKLFVANFATLNVVPKALEMIWFTRDDVDRWCLIPQSSSITKLGKQAHVSFDEAPLCSPLLLETPVICVSLNRWNIRLDVKQSRHLLKSVMDDVIAATDLTIERNEL